MNFYIYKVINGRNLAILLLVIFFLLLYPNLKTFPYSDDWSYLSYLSNNDLFNIDYLFSQHNDHRIPLQKILHLMLLKFSGGDFRVLIGLNAFTVFFISLIWISIYKFFNDNCVIETIFPLVAFSYGFNSVNWGFSFQFVSSVFFASLCLLLWLHYLDSKKKVLVSVFISLIALSLSGGNGLILSTILGCYFCIFIFFRDRGVYFEKLFLYLKIKFIILLWFVSILFIWFTLKKSSATMQTSSDLLVYFDFFVHSISAYFGLLLSFYTKSLICLGIVVVVLSCAIFLLLYIRNSNFLLKNRIESIFVFLTSNIVLLLGITISRASFQNWSSGLELHYGFLSIPIIFCFVTLFSLLRTKKLLYLVLIFSLYSYSFNYSWRMRMQHETNLVLTQCYNLIISKSEPNISLSKKCIGEFNWKSSPDDILDISKKIDKLRLLPFYKY